MEKLYEFRKARADFPNCKITSMFDKLITVLDELTKEGVSCLSEMHSSEEYKIIDKFIHKPMVDERKIIIFGLYTAVLRAYEMNFDVENSSLSIEEKLRNNFQKEFNLFISENEKIFEKYAKYFSLKPIEIEEISQLLKEAKIDGGEWNTETADMIML